MKKRRKFLEEHWISSLVISIIFLFLSMILWEFRKGVTLCEDLFMPQVVDIRDWMVAGSLLCCILGIILFVGASIGGGRAKLRKRIRAKEKRFSESYQKLLENGYKDIFIATEELKKISFEDESRTVEYQNRIIGRFREEWKEFEIGQKKWHRVVLWLEEASDLCDAEQIDVETMVTEVAMLIALLTLIVTAMPFIGITIGSMEGNFFGVIVMGIMVWFNDVFNFEKEYKEQFNRSLRWRKMLLRSVEREMQEHLSIFKKEREGKEKIGENNVPIQNIQLKILGKEIIQISWEKRFP
ncbi:MAG: hypothetical protein Q4A78_00460 [Peptostreptococcaceae bacterium]|nr:hypothetical protein [Peptostreptococcaceae bacterium]